MAKKITKQELEADVAGLRGWLGSITAPVARFFEGRFVWLALLPVGIWAYLDRALLKTWLSLILGVVLIVGVALVVRKVVMPKVDIQAAAEKAQQDPVGAALVFLGGVAFMIVVILAAVFFLSGMRG